MARTADRRNVIIIYTQFDGTWRGRGVEVDSTGTIALGTAKTSTGELGALKSQLIQPNASGGTTPEGSALYDPSEIVTEVFVPKSQAV